MEYNVVGAYVGNSTPVFIIRDADRQEKEKQITVQLEFNF
jgi:precorrin-3B methylase